MSAFRILQKAIQGGRKLTDALTLAAPAYEAHVWGSSNLDSTVPFRESFTSAEQTITSAGSLTLAHSLSASPELIQVRLICKTAEGGYSIDDEVIINPGEGGAVSGVDRGLSIVLDATNINIRYGADAIPVIVIRKDNGVVFVITNANWRLIIKAWA